MDKSSLTVNQVMVEGGDAAAEIMRALSAMDSDPRILQSTYEHHKLPALRESIVTLTRLQDDPEVSEDIRGAARTRRKELETWEHCAAMVTEANRLGEDVPTLSRVWPHWVAQQQRNGFTLEPLPRNLWDMNPRLRYLTVFLAALGIAIAVVGMILGNEDVMRPGAELALGVTGAAMLGTKAWTELIEKKRLPAPIPFTHDDVAALRAFTPTHPVWRTPLLPPELTDGHVNHGVTDALFMRLHTEGNASETARMWVHSARPILDLYRSDREPLSAPDQAMMNRLADELIVAARDMDWERERIANEARALDGEQRRDAARAVARAEFERNRNLPSFIPKP